MLQESPHQTLSLPDARILDFLVSTVGSYVNYFVSLALLPQKMDKGRRLCKVQVRVTRGFHLHPIGVGLLVT